MNWPFFGTGPRLRMSIAGGLPRITPWSTSKPRGRSNSRTAVWRQDLRPTGLRLRPREDRSSARERSTIASGTRDHQGGSRANEASKEAIRSAPAFAEIAASDRDALVAAYQAGVITSWKRDIERGYRVSIAGRPDGYVDVSHLIKYLTTLGGAA